MLVVVLGSLHWALSSMWMPKM
uniref:Chloroplast inner envelope protein n=1 Tax=Rhizophora mucronata TaxID=61149 RepID=A0A2P2NSZ5_RHIMU